VKLEPTDDLDRAKSDLAEHGLCLIDALGSEETARVRARLLDAAREDREAGRGYVYDHAEANQRVWTLLNRGPEFVDLVQRPFAMELVGHLIGRPALLSNFSANVTGPGGGYGVLHSDQFYVPWHDRPYAANVAWLITDFTAANGGTRVVLGSHLRGRAPQPGESAPDAIPLEAPAGTAAVLDARLWHQTGPNTTRDEHRIGLFAYYIRPFLRAQENWAVSIDAQVRRNASPVLKELLGETPYLTLGAVDGQPLDGPRF
jgi:ectoine hydroxylase-related dioxygenase (phytanoyl-CoA dioxygenase family)